MDYSWLIPLLALITLLAVVVFALISKERTEERRHDPDAPISSLAKDGKYGGVAFLATPEDRRRRAAHAEENVQERHDHLS